jgi:hypothetical protein
MVRNVGVIVQQSAGETNLRNVFREFVFDFGNIEELRQWIR